MTGSPHRIWFEDESVYDPRRVATIRHSFDTHPLLQLDALKRLALKFEEQRNGQVKFFPAGTTHAGSLGDMRSESYLGKTIAETFDEIETPGSWVSLYSVASDPEYRQMLREALGTVRHLVDAKDPGMFDVDGFIFISSPPSATPFHIDLENNFILQVHGKKQLSVWQPDDRATVSEEDVEHKVGHGAVSAAPFKEESMARCAFDAELHPGEGVYMPSTAPHMTRTQSVPVTPDDTYSITIGTVFFTDATRRAAHLYAYNNFLRRRLHMRPSPPYGSAVRDRIKYPLARAFTAAKFSMRGRPLPAGMTARLPT